MPVSMPNRMGVSPSAGERHTVSSLWYEEVQAVDNQVSPAFSMLQNRSTPFGELMVKRSAVPDKLPDSVLPSV